MLQGPELHPQYAWPDSSLFLVIAFQRHPAKLCDGIIQDVTPWQPSSFSCHMVPSNQLSCYTFFMPSVLAV